MEGVASAADGNVVNGDRESPGKTEAEKLRTKENVTIPEGINPGVCNLGKKKK